MEGGGRRESERGIEGHSCVAVDASTSDICVSSTTGPD